MQIIKVYTQKDIDNIPRDRPIQLEIYKKLALIDLEQLDGHCFVRAKNCIFPNLKSINGNLSVDAAAALFTNLIEVKGDCVIHEDNCELPVLRRVKRNLEIHAPVDLPNLKEVGYRLINKTRFKLPNASVLPVLNINITSEADLEKIPSEGRYHLNILANNITFEQEYCPGTIVIAGDNIVFSNLKYANNIVMHNKDRRADLADIQFPKLERVFRNLKLLNSGASFPCLTAVNGRVIITQQDNVSFPLLKKVGTLVTSWIDSAHSALSADNESVRIEKNLSNFPSLEIISKYASFRQVVYLPKLKRVHSLFYELPLIKPLSYFFPKIENIDIVSYDEFQADIYDKIRSPYFQVLPNVYVSSNSIGLGRALFNNMLPFLRQKFPLSIFVSILKMRHASFESFLSREVKREWNTFNVNLDFIVKKIKKLWNNTEAMTFEEVFKMQDMRLRGLRRFAFSYVGISTLMSALDAKRIATQGIELNYYRYDDSGNKVTFKKHNIYELYEADVSNIRELNSWGTANKMYAVKCWCTSTNHEHWLWIEAHYKDDPLTAIASTFRVHENVIPHIKCLKRQGDILICEMKKQVIPSGPIRPLTPKEYFGLLEVET